ACAVVCNLRSRTAAVRCSGAHGPKWAKRGLPPDLQGKVKNAVTYERTVTWHRAVAHHPLYYLDFPDLKKIILNGSNWPTAFAEIFGHNAKAGTEATLSELELLRNKVAHNRLV